MTSALAAWSADVCFWSFRKSLWKSDNAREWSQIASQITGDVILRSFRASNARQLSPLLLASDLSTVTSESVTSESVTRAESVTLCIHQISLLVRVQVTALEPSLPSAFKLWSSKTLSDSPDTFRCRLYGVGCAFQSLPVYMVHQLGGNSSSWNRFRDSVLGMLSWEWYLWNTFCNKLETTSFLILHNSLTPRVIVLLIAAVTPLDSLEFGSTGNFF